MHGLAVSSAPRRGAHAAQVVERVRARRQAERRAREERRGRLTDARVEEHARGEQHAAPLVDAVLVRIGRSVGGERAAGDEHAFGPAGGAARVAHVCDARVRGHRRRCSQGALGLQQGLDVDGERGQGCREGRHGAARGMQHEGHRCVLHHVLEAAGRQARLEQKESVATREDGKHGDHEHTALRGKHGNDHWTAGRRLAAYALGKTGSDPHEGAVGDLARRFLAEVEQGTARRARHRPLTLVLALALGGGRLGRLECRD
eukprot:scaffold13392_cov71-Phaeocystis_antarctica.AAC.2